MTCFQSSMCLQQSLMGDVRIRDAGLEVLSSYHPFWLKLGLELVTGKPVRLTAKSVKRQVAQLEAFILEHFLNDAELAYQWALNKAIDGLYSSRFWVCTCQGFSITLDIPYALLQELFRFPSHGKQEELLKTSESFCAKL